MMKLLPTLRVIVLVALSAGIFGQLRAQDAQVLENSPIQFSGSTRLYGQSSNRQGSDQGLPASFLRWELNSILTTYGLPISINALVTSEQNSTSQRLNYFSIGLSQMDYQAMVRQKIDEKVQNLEALAEKTKQQGIEAVTDSLQRYSPGSLKDVAQLDQIDKLHELQNLKPGDLQRRASELKDLGITTAVSSVASLFPTLAFGTMFPQYTPLTLGGVPVTGADIEFTPGPAYMAFTVGKILDANQGSSGVPSALTDASFGRRLTAGRLGIGRKDESHFYLTALYGKDDLGSLKRDSLNAATTPQANYVFGTEGVLRLFEDRLSLSGEYAVSLLASDVEGVGSPTPAPHWVESITGAGKGGTYDYAFNIQALYNVTETNTRISALVRRIGPGYSSFGVPYLRTDNLRVETKLEQALMDRQVSVAGYYRRDEDNLRSTKDGSTVMNAFGAQLGLNFRDYPFLRLSYAPLSQQSKRVSDSLKVQNDVTVASAVTGYTYRARSGMFSSTVASLSYQEGKPQSGIRAYITRNYLLTEVVGFSLPLLVNVTGGMNETVIDTTRMRFTTIDGAISYTALEVWQNTLGVSLVRDAVKRTSISFTTGVPIGRIAVLSLSVERTNYENPVDGTGNYKETLVRAMLSKTW